MLIKPAGQPIDLWVRTKNGNVFATLAGSPALEVYRDDNTTPSTLGITLTVDFAGLVGVHHVRIDTTADPTFYVNGRVFDAQFTAGTVAGVSVVKESAGEFQLSAVAGYAAPLDAAGTRTAIGLATANLDTQLDALPTNAELATALAAADDPTLAAIAALGIPALSALVTAIKAKTDKLTFDADNALDANVQKINDAELTGDGSPSTPWGPS